MSSLNKLSTIVESQLPQFIRDEHPTFVEFMEKYYEFLEQPGNPIYELKKFEDNYDVDETRSTLLQYFKNKILPSFPDKSELSTERILKSARDFYTKKGSPDSFKFLFKVLYGQELEIFFPKLQILKASDGKWVLPQAFRLTLSPANLGVDVNLLEKRKGFGSLSRASCIIEHAVRTIDKGTNREIVEVYISSLNRLFQNGELLEIEYIDENGATQVFAEKIIGALSNIRINPRRRGTKYKTGDPVVINGGLDELSETKVKAVAVVGNVTTGSIDAVTTLRGGYGHRLFPNSLIDVISANGIGANLIVTGVDTGNLITINYNTDSLLYKVNEVLSAGNYDFDNVLNANINTTLQSAFTFESINLYPISQVTLINGGSFFDVEPSLDVIPLYDSDYSTFEGVDGLIVLTPGNFNSYNNVNSSIKFAGSAYAWSTQDDFYLGWRILVEKHFRTITRYDGATKTAFLDRSFEKNVTPFNILTKNIYLDPRPVISDMGRIAAIEILNGGTGYDSANDSIFFIGTGYSGAATFTVNGTGSISSITITNRGEGYPLAPEVYVNSSTGTGAILKAYLFGEGEDFDVITGEIGQIQDIVLINRGSDYISTPNVSLKIYDLNVSPILDSEIILENDIAYQGIDLANSTFRGIVDSYYPSNNIIRIFNFSGAPTVGQNLVITRESSGVNVNTLVSTANVNGNLYPRLYGDGRARANAEFLNGLIRYNGFYLNTDGHISSDKRLQDSEKYHNFSYSLSSEIGLDVYEKTVKDTLHPTGAKLLAIHNIKEDKDAGTLSKENVHSIKLISDPLTNNCNVGYNSTVVTGINENFDTVANVNDIIVINSANTNRLFAKVITAVDSNNSLNIESSCLFVGEGRARTNSDNAIIRISGNTNTIIKFIDVTDQIRINVGGNVLLKTINSIAGNAVTLNSNVGISATSANLIYEVIPQFNVVQYEIIRTLQ